MVTLGDVFLLFAAMVGISFAIWGAMLLTCMLFPARCAAAAQELEFHPWRAFGIGLAVFLPVVIVGGFLTALPLPIFKVAGVGVYLLLLSLAAFGSGGLARLVGQRVQTTGGASTFYGGYVKGATLVVLTCHLPILGWFLLAPVILICSLGAGIKGLVRGRPSAAWPGQQTETP